MKKIANRYSVALFDLSIEENKLEDYQQQLAWLKDVFEDNTVFLFFSSVKVDSTKKKDVLDSIVSANVDQHILSFIKILIEKRRMTLIKTIIEQFHSLYNQHHNIQEGIVYSIRTLSDQELLNIEDAVGKKLESEVKLKNYLNPSLLSGIKIVVNDVVIDASMQSKMSQLREQLLKESR